MRLRCGEMRIGVAWCGTNKLQEFLAPLSFAAKCDEDHLVVTSLPGRANDNLMGTSLSKGHLDWKPQIRFLPEQHISILQFVKLANVLRKQNKASNFL